MIDCQAPWSSAAKWSQAGEREEEESESDVKSMLRTEFGREKKKMSDVSKEGSSKMQGGEVGEGRILGRLQSHQAPATWQQTSQKEIRPCYFSQKKHGLLPEARRSLTVSRP